jgi:hypothetical protein
MPKEIETALIILAVTFIGAMGTVILYFRAIVDTKTKRIRADFEAEQQRRQDKRERERLETEQQMAQLKAQVESAHANSVSIEHLTEAVVDLVQGVRARDKDLTYAIFGTKEALTNNTESLGGMIEGLEAFKSLYNERNARLFTKMDTVERNGIERTSQAEQAILERIDALWKEIADVGRATSGRDACSVAGAIPDATQPGAM